MKARVLALIAVLLWSTAATAFRLTLRYLPPFQVVLIASTVSLSVLTLVILARRPLPTFGWRYFRGAAMRGFLNPFLYYLVLLEAYNQLPAQVAMVINYLWPVVLVLMSAPLLRQKVTGRALGALGVCFAGVAVMALGGGSVLGSLPAGAMGLALFSTVVWALFWLTTLRTAGDRVSALAGGFLFGVLYLLLAGLITGRLPDPGEIPWQGLAGAVYIGLFEMGITFVVWLRALSLAGTTAEVGNLVYLTPFLSLVLIGIFTGETVSPWTIIGLVLVIAGIVMGKRGEPPVRSDPSGVT